MNEELTSAVSGDASTATVPPGPDLTDLPNQLGAAPEETDNSELITMDLSDLPDQPEPITMDLSDLPDQPNPLEGEYTARGAEFVRSEAPLSTEKNLESGLSRYGAALLSYEPELHLATPNELGDFRFEKPKSFEESMLDAVGQPGFYTDAADLASKVGYEQLTPWVDEQATEGLNFLAGSIDRQKGNKLVSSFLPGQSDLTSSQARAEAANLYAMSAIAGRPPSWVRKHMAELNSEVFETGRPLHQVAEELLMTGFMSAGAIEMLTAASLTSAVLTGLKFAGGIEAYELLGEYAGKLRDRLFYNPEMEGQPLSLLEFAPEDSGELTKTALVLLDMHAKAKIIHQGYRGLQAGWDHIGYQTMRRALPTQNLYLPTDRVEAALERGEGLSPLEFEIVNGLRMTPAEFRQAKDLGLHLEIPNITLMEQIDAPWLSRVKNLLNITPYEHTEVGQAGRPALTFGREAAEKAGAPPREETKPEEKPVAEGAPEKPAEELKPAAEPTTEGVPAGEPAPVVEAPLPERAVEQELPAPAGETAGMKPHEGADIITGGVKVSRSGAAPTAAESTPLSSGTLKGPAGYAPPEGRSIREEAMFIRLGMRKIESGGNYNVVSKDGGRGAYQFMPGTWAEYSREYTRAKGEEPSVLPMTPENQDAVAQWKVEQYLEQGYSPQQIASLWNSGHPDWAGRVGLNKWGVKYDVPYHIKKFSHEYSKLSGLPVPEHLMDRERVSDALRSVLPEEQHETTMGFLDAMARSWADKYADTGATERDFWVEKLADLRVDPRDLRLLERPVEGLAPERVVFDADDPRTLYQTEGTISKPDEFLKAPGGSTEWGQIGPEVAEKIGRQAGPIKLQFGTNEGGDRHGWVHVKERHEREIRATGYPDVDRFIHDVVQNYDQVYQGKGASLVLVKRNERAKLAMVELRPSESGEFYRVNSSWVSRPDYLNRFKLLWERSAPAQESSGESPPYYQSTVEAGGDRRSARGRSTAENIPPGAEPGKRERYRTIKGAIDFLEDGRAVITLFRGADVGTIVHEFGGHLGRRLLDATDTAIVERWLGVKDGLWERKHEERFATAFQRYVMEGVSPSTTLRGIFSKLKAWLLDIYRQAGKVFPDEIPDDVRAVFDRMLTTEAERKANMVNRLADEYSMAGDEHARMAERGTGKGALSDVHREGYDSSEATLPGPTQSRPGEGAERAPKESIAPLERESKTLFETTGKEPPEGPERKAANVQDEYQSIQAEAYRRAWAEVKKEDLKARKKTEAILRREAADAYENVQVYKDVKEAIKGGGISIDSLRDYSADVRQRLMRRWPKLLRKDSRYGIDEFAMDRGYESVDELVDVLRNAPTKGEYIENHVADGLREYGGEAGLSSEEWLARLLKHEIDIMKELTEKNTRDWANVPRKGFSKVVNELTGVTMVRDTQMITEHDALKAGMQKAARAAKEAWRAGDKAGALREKFKQEQILELYKAKLNAREEATKIKRQLISFLGVKDLDPDYRDALADLTRYVAPKLGADIVRRVDAYKGEGYTMGDFLAASNETYANMLEQKGKGQPLMELLSGLQERGEFFPVDVQDIYALLAKPWREFTVDDLRSVRDIARMIVKMSRIEGKLISGERKATFEQTMNDLLVEGMETAYGRGKNAPSTPAERLQAIAGRTYEQSWLTKFLYSQVVPEYAVRDLDGWRDFGPNHNNIIRPIMQARGRENILVEKISERLKEAEDRFEKDSGVRFDRWMSQKVDVFGMEKPLRREQILFAWANSLNPANLKALRSVFKDPQQLDAILSMITPAEKDLVQAYNRVYEELLWPELSGTYRKLTGQRLRKVEGFYWPIIVDPRLMLESEMLISKTGVKDLFQSIWDRAVVPSGMTKERTGTAKPPKLEYGAMLAHLRNTAHWISFALPVRDVQKVISDPRFMEMVTRTRGRAFADIFNPWLQDVANPNRGLPFSPGERFMDALRRSNTLYTLGWSLNASLKHFTEFTLSGQELGYTGMMRGFLTMLRNPIGMFDEINKLSVQMRTSHESWDRDVMAVLQTLSHDVPRWKTFLTSHLMDLMTFSDRCARYPAWIEAYQQALEGRGKWKGNPLPQDKAIEWADQVVRVTKAMGGEENLPAALRERGYAKLFTQFMTWAVKPCNATFESWKRARFDPEYSYGNFLKAAFLLYVATPVLTRALTKRELPNVEDEEWWKSQALDIVSYMAMPIPHVRDVVSGMVMLHEYKGGKGMPEVQLSPVGRSLEMGAKLAESVIDAIDDWDLKPEMLPNALDAVSALNPGRLGGFPTRQMITAVKGAIDLYTDRSDTGWSLLDRGARYEGMPRGGRRRRVHFSR